MRRFINRRFVTVTALAAALALAGATGADAQLERVIDPDWTLPRTADGQPDLQGLWGNKTITPMERPAALEGRAFLTDEEMAQRNRQRALDEAARDAAPAQRYQAGGNVGGMVSAGGVSSMVWSFRHRAGRHRPVSSAPRCVEARMCLTP